MNQFIDEVLLLGASRTDGVHWLPVDGLDRPYAVDNGNAIYIFLPHTHDIGGVDATKASLGNIKLVKSSSQLIDMEQGYKLFEASRIHTRNALLLLSNIFVAVIANPELFYDE